jgi:uncharacterized membrane protein YjjP (DUF1212 family)
MEKKQIEKKLWFLVFLSSYLLAETVAWVMGVNSMTDYLDLMVISISFFLAFIPILIVNILIVRKYRKLFFFFFYTTLVLFIIGNLWVTNGYMWSDSGSLSIPLRLGAVIGQTLVVPFGGFTQ